MTNPSITPKAIGQAITQFDELGRNRFLKEYGFKRAREYFLVHKGRFYDSKPIVGAAHGFANPGEGALKAAEFSGGEATVKTWLEELGYDVIRLPGGRIFGEIPGYPQGTTFPDRTSLTESGVHPPSQAGICGSSKDGGAESIVVSGVYEDDRDYGDLIVYTGFWGTRPHDGPPSC